MSDIPRQPKSGMEGVWIVMLAVILVIFLMVLAYPYAMDGFHRLAQPLKPLQSGQS